jgi:hypothetical protein
VLDWLQPVQQLVSNQDGPVYASLVLGCVDMLNKNNQSGLQLPPLGSKKPDQTRLSNTNHVKIMWAFLFMKSDQVAHFVDRQMHNYQEVGGLPYSTWSDFVHEFIGKFCLKNEILITCTDLKTS